MREFRVDIIRHKDKELLWSEIVPAKTEMEADQKVTNEFFESEFYTDEAFFCETEEVQE